MTQTKSNSAELPRTPAEQTGDPDRSLRHLRSELSQNMPPSESPEISSTLLRAAFPTGLLQHPTRAYMDVTEPPVSTLLQPAYEVRLQKEIDGNCLQFASGQLRPTEPTSVNFDESGWGRMKGEAWHRKRRTTPSKPSPKSIHEWQETEAKLRSFNRELIRSDLRTDLALFPLLHPCGSGAHDPRAKDRIPDTWYNRIRSLHYCDFWRTNLNWVMYRLDMFLKNKILFHNTNVRMNKNAIPKTLDELDVFLQEL